MGHVHIADPKALSLFIFVFKDSGFCTAVSEKSTHAVEQEAMWFFNRENITSLALLSDSACICEHDKTAAEHKVAVRT